MLRSAGGLHGLQWIESDAFVGLFGAAEGLFSFPQLTSFTWELRPSRGRGRGGGTPVGLPFPKLLGAWVRPPPRLLGSAKPWIRPFSVSECQERLSWGR